MRTDNPQKVKLLFLLEILRQESDEQTPIKTNELCQKLFDRGIPCDRRTLSTDIQILNSFGFEVMRTKIGKSFAYYIDDRSFSVPELKILIDAIQAANFISEAKTEDFIVKLSSLGGTYKSKILRSNIVYFNTRKHTNESIYYTVQYLEEALLKGKAISFRYYKLNEKAEKIYRKQERYYADPVGLVYIDDNYYLVTYNSKYDDITNYRIDRMEYVEIENDDICDAAKNYRNRIGKYTNEIFHMFGGELHKIELSFSENLISVIQDKFGENIHITPKTENLFSTQVDIQISPTFFGWLFQFAGEMQISSPYTIKKQYEDFLINSVALLNTGKNE